MGHTQVLTLEDGRDVTLKTLGTKPLVLGKLAGCDLQLYNSKCGRPMSVSCLPELITWFEMLLSDVVGIRRLSLASVVEWCGGAELRENVTSGTRPRSAKEGHGYIFVYFDKWSNFWWSPVRLDHSAYDIYNDQQDPSLLLQNRNYIYINSFVQVRRWLTRYIGRERPWILFPYNPHNYLIFFNLNSRKI